MEKQKSPLNTNEIRSTIGTLASDAISLLNGVTLHRLFFTTTTVGYVIIAFSGNMQTGCQWWMYIKFIIAISIFSAFTRLAVEMFRRREQARDKKGGKIENSSKSKEVILTNV